MANRIVSAVPDDALREGIEVERTVGTDDAQPDQEVVDQGDDQAQLEGRIRELEAVDRVREAMTWARCQGGAAVMLLVDGAGLPHEPMDDDRVTRVVGLTVVDRGDLTPASWYQDPTLPKFGEVETWYINIFTSQGMTASNIRVHETRLVMFRGAMTSRRERIRNAGWDHSVLQKSINILRQTNTAWDSVVHMMNDLSQAVFKINGLIDAIAEDDHKNIQKRMAITDMVRSVARAIVLDAENEDFKVVERGAVTGVDALLDKTFLRLAAAARMPVSILMGQAPAGLNATGAVDLRWWYDTVRTAQTHEIKPRLERIVRLIARELFPGQDASQWVVCFPSLWQMTPTEEADLRTKVAATDKAYVDMQAVLPEEITLSRFGRGEYSTGYVVDLESRKRILEAELAKAEEKATQPDPIPPDPNAPPPPDPNAPPPPNPPAPPPGQ